VGVALVDVLTCKDAVTGILAALAGRSRAGRGQHIEVSLLTGLLGGLVNQVSGYLTTGNPPRRMGNQHPSIAPYETLRCGAGVLAVACGNDRQFGRLAAAIGRPELATDERFAANPSRVANREALVKELEEALEAASAAEWEARLAAVGVPAGQVNDIGAAVARAEELSLSPLLDLGDGAVPQVRHPVTYAGSSTAAPGLRAAAASVRFELRELNP
jgi:formyl-CoA transferase